MATWRSRVRTTLTAAVAVSSFVPLLVVAFTSQHLQSVPVAPFVTAVLLALVMAAATAVLAAWIISGHLSTVADPTKFGDTSGDDAYDDSLDTASAPIRDADVAVHRAEHGGADTVERFDADMGSWVQSRHELDIELRKAIDRRAIDVHYQPIVELRTGRYTGMEALVRWNDPHLGPVPPDVFIPIAEKSGLIVALGDLILTTVCEQMARWQRNHADLDVTVSVNLSARELMQADCTDRVRRTLDRFGVAPERLNIEVTESILVTDAATAIRNLHLLRRLGVAISLDDFGTGYSSLAYLRELPVDVVKIDRSFIGELVADGGRSSIVSMVISLGRSLGVRVVAEGIETQRQLDELQQLGGEYAQGYLFSRPLPAERAEALMWPEIVLA